MINPNPNPWAMAPFAILLAAMALGPVVAHTWWTRHYAKMALGLGAITDAYYIFGLHAPGSVGHAAHEYFSFVTLVGGLFVVAGGIHIGVRSRGRPLGNVLFLLIGAVLANLLGTTGAAMLLIRPWIRLNQARIKAFHIVFFIFVVANVGGCLTPIGDPPLFLGYLQGVPFWWVAEHCWRMWAVGVGLLLAGFYCLDQRDFARAAAQPPAGAVHPEVVGDIKPVHLGELDDLSSRPKAATCRRTPKWPAGGNWRLEGRANLVFLAVMLGAVFVNHPVFLREGLMVAAALGSYFTTPKAVHEANGFNFHPIQEVAILFAGIFATMLPALDWLGTHAGGWLGPNPAPGVFYWGTGLLSSVLDNAPTYLAFFRSLTGVAAAPDTAALLQGQAASVAALSVGAVFFGAATYIGNGPNFMVKAIADQEKIPMPSFVEFVVKQTLPWLLPVLVIVWLGFFRG
jgi:Na+/H+ antiporter NhaD/arsenite permease-like protein